MDIAIQIILLSQHHKLEKHLYLFRVLLVPIKYYQIIELSLNSVISADLILLLKNFRAVFPSFVVHDLALSRRLVNLSQIEIYFKSLFSEHYKLFYLYLTLLAMT